MGKRWQVEGQAAPPALLVFSGKRVFLSNGWLQYCLVCGMYTITIYNLNVLNSDFVCFLVHAAVIAINEAIDRRVPADTFTALKNPNAMLVNLEEPLASTYQDVLYQAKQDKMTNAKNRVKMQHLPS